jgi:hypothetical protein
LALRWRGSIWQVIGTPIARSSTDSRPGSNTTSPHQRDSTGTTRSWRFQAQTGPSSPVLEFEMNVDPRMQDWRLRRVAVLEGY